MGSCKLLSWSVCLLIFTENALHSAVFREINTYWHLEALLPRFCPRWLAVKSHRGWIKMIANVLEQCIFGHPQGQTVNGGSSAYRMCLKPYTVWSMENSSSVTFQRKLHNMYMTCMSSERTLLYFQKVHHSSGIIEHFHAFFRAWGLLTRVRNEPSRPTVSLLSNYIFKPWVQIVFSSE